MCPRPHHVRGHIYPASEAQICDFQAALTTSKNMCWTGDQPARSASLGKGGMWLPQDQIPTPTSSRRACKAHSWAAHRVTMEFSVLRNQAAATSRKRASFWKMKVRDPWGLRSLLTTHERESLPGLEGAKADSKLRHSCKNLPASFPLLLPLLPLFHAPPTAT